MQTVVETQDDHREPAQRSSAQLFAYSTWIHVGPDAENCADVDEQTPVVSCSDPLHFHAWCRLPNQFQHRDIREKALAARARRARQLRDPDSDSYAILEDDMQAIMRKPDAVGELVEELVATAWWKDYQEAVKDLQEVEDERDERPWATIDDDRRRYTQLQSLDPSQRPAEEFAELEKHIAAYLEALTARHQAILDPRRDALRERPVEELLAAVRDERISAEAQDEFLHIYNTWEWYVGTFVAPNGAPKFASLEAMQSSAPEIIQALQVTYDDLEHTLNEASGKVS